MSSAWPLTVRELLLMRRGVVCVGDEDASATATANDVRGLALELASIGYVPSPRLELRLTRCSPDALRELRDWVCPALLAQAGGDRQHVPLFRRFPDDVPADTIGLWWKKVLVHYLQDELQPCLFCGGIGTTHVLDPCGHVVCDRCFDGSNYSACPSCEHQVDTASPFFQPSPERAVPAERVTFRRLDAAESMEAEARALFVALCERTQALSPQDREALTVLVRAYGVEVLRWIPPAIPVRENVAVIFGTLLSIDAAAAMAHAKPFLTTATDVLRLIAVWSGTDGSLLPETVYRRAQVHNEERGRFWDHIQKLLGVSGPSAAFSEVTIPMRVRRFKVARMPRPMRRAFLAQLESFDRDRLVEDMLRHRSFWVWVGEFLHPHEYAARFPNVARAFHVVRGNDSFETWNGRVEKGLRDGDVAAVLPFIGKRPGELARKLDHLLRIAGDTEAGADVLDVFRGRVSALATPVLLTLASHLPLRDRTADVRVYWPKGRAALGASSLDRRLTLPRAFIHDAVRAIEAELLARFAAKPAFDVCVIDDALRTIVVPFNERTASPASVALPRGSRIAVPGEKHVRLFLHWCQPALGGSTTDLDLSVAFYSDAWTYMGVCAYYELTYRMQDKVIARSGGDLRDAPFPDGATELVDVDRDAAREAGVRYAVMVLNNYAGMPFRLLDRGFAGLMLRDDLSGAHFDPRTVALKFTVSGDNGVYLPLVFDLEQSVMHWLDVQSKGQLEMNNVESSRAGIARICPRLMSYFASGTRPSMLDLARLHAASRCGRVFVRGATIAEFVRAPGESAVAFHDRLRGGRADREHSALPPLGEEPVLAILERGDFDPPPSSSTYALFREQVTPTLAASDLI